ncbi:hypothetical protein [Jeotgalibaca ciconiae]|uniref:Uncharacterized protein n=1 Tax=Jeotgalibaca ciconiae TaxID=2496265 RepID=A0A3Q9BLX7_9LACT|nr:hypothetical protein [Jeotgalibaca ciconiae]AZP05402.1 hypothetical protein EJN90_12525 [Jeotgalibaca ciconiae]
MNKINKSYIDKLTNFIKISFLLTLFIFIICDTSALSTTHVSNQDQYAFLFDYLEGNLLDSELVEVRAVTHAEKIVSPISKKTKAINDKMEFSVYTYMHDDGTDINSHTIIDYSFKEPMKVKYNDSLSVKIGGYLRPITPISSIMLTKSNVDEDWEIVKKPTPVMNSLQSFTLEGDELANSDSYSRVLIDIPAYVNPEATDNILPEFQINYVSDSSIYFNLSGLQMLLIGIIILVLLPIFIKFILRRFD